MLSDLTETPSLKYVGFQVSNYTRNWWCKTTCKYVRGHEWRLPRLVKCPLNIERVMIGLLVGEKINGWEGEEAAMQWNGGHVSTTKGGEEA